MDYNKGLVKLSEYTLLLVAIVIAAKMIITSLSLVDVCGFFALVVSVRAAQVIRHLTEGRPYFSELTELKEELNKLKSEQEQMNTDVTALKFQKNFKP